MTVSLNIVADDAVDLIRQIRALAGLPSDVIPVVRESSVSAAAVTAHIAASEAKENEQPNIPDAEEDAADEAAGKPRRTRRTKAEIEAARLAEAAQGASAGEPVLIAPEQGASVSEDEKSGASIATKLEESPVDDDPFAPDPIDSGEDDPNTPHVSDYGARLIGFKAANEGKSAQDFIMAELKRFADKHGGTAVKEGLDAVRGLMTAFGYPRVSAVPEDKYPALLAAIDAEMAK